MQFFFVATDMSPELAELTSAYQALNQTLDERHRYLEFHFGAGRTAMLEQQNHAIITNNFELLGKMQETLRENALQITVRTAALILRRTKLQAEMSRLLGAVEAVDAWLTNNMTSSLGTVVVLCRNNAVAALELRKKALAEEAHLSRLGGDTNCVGGQDALKAAYKEAYANMNTPAVRHRFGAY